MQLNFRSAFNGFNREDVVHYIEYLNSKHAADLNQLNSELDYLRTKHAPQPLPDPVDDDIVMQQAARIRELFDRCTGLEKELELLKEEKTQLTAQLESAQQQAAAYPSVNEELEAYRRAERTERYARERAEQLYHQANGALADATVKVDDAAGHVAEITERVISQLTELQDALAGSKQAMRDAAATMYTIRPTDHD